jgi:predicted DNA-binding transcriptional regulator YafY
LQAYPRITGAELAERLELDPRTVRRYIAMLQEWGIPILAKRGRYGAYQLMPGFKLPPLMFTEDEALALTLSLLVAKESGLAQVAPAFDGALAKVERVLPASTRSRIQAVEQTVAFGGGAAPPGPSGPAVLALSSAIQSGQRVLMSYRSSQDELTQRAFDPYGIAYHLDLWYTIGYCHLRKDRRLFRLDRIREIELTSESFSPPANFHALEEVQRALASVKRQWRIEVWLQTTLPEAQRQLRSANARFEEMDGGVLFRVEVADLPWMARTLAGLGVPFRILHPPELPEVMREYAEALASYAQPSGEHSAISLARHSRL